jgi:cation:H+ antiporter
MIEYVLFVIGILFLVKGAELLVDGSSSLAKRLGVPSLFIGLTIVAFGTSFPEFTINIFSSVIGKTDIGLGNIIGANILNLLLILGISIIIRDVHVRDSTLWYEIPFTIAAATMLLILSLKPFFIAGAVASINAIDGMILILFFIAYMMYIYRSVQIKDSDDIKKDVIAEVPKDNRNYVTIFFMISLGIIGLFFGGKWVVNGAVSFARLFNLSEYLISMTIVSIGTTLPEMITSIIAMIKKDEDMSIGNVIGSNIFNVFAILGISSLITPIAIHVSFELIFHLLITILIFAFILIPKASSRLLKKSNRGVLTRWHGIVLIGLYILYILILIVKK